MSPLLQLDRVTKTFQSGPKRLQVLRQIDLILQPGEFLAITGASGSGKTTLLNMIAGLDRIDSGHIYLEERELTGQSTADWDRTRCEDMGFIFQFNQLLPEFTALENVMLPGLLSGRGQDDLMDQARELLDRMGMSERMDHAPARLSGGEQQRVAIARALINRPKLLLADEPTGSLDWDTGRRVFDHLLELQEVLGIACLVVTHNPELAALCARIQSLDQLGVRKD